MVEVSAMFVQIVIFRSPFIVHSCDNIEGQLAFHALSVQSNELTHAGKITLPSTLETLAALRDELYVPRRTDKSNSGQGKHNSSSLLNIILL
jgi:hypothetical protein